MASDVAPLRDPWDALTWSGQVTTLPAAHVEQADPSTAAPFIVTVAGGDAPLKYWAKALNGPEGPFALIAEAIVSRLGALTGAPVCETAFIDVSAFAGFAYAPGYALSGELAYATRDVPGGQAKEFIQHRTIGDNRARLAREYVLYEWCLGGDDQWLYDTDRRVYSHDHGRWLLNTKRRFAGPPIWSATSLEAHGGARWGSVQHETAIAVAPDEVRSAAHVASSITHNDLVSVLDPIVSAWADCGLAFADGLSLEATMRRVGSWLETRRDAVVSHLGA
jgi:hypothetical protein